LVCFFLALFWLLMDKSNIWKTIDNLESDPGKRAQIITFLTRNDDEFMVPASQFPWWIEWVVSLFSEKGKIIIAEKWEEIIGLLWITFGEPSKNYENKEIGYLYLLLVEEKYRRRRENALGFFQKMLEEMNVKWVKTIRFKTFVEEDYLNTLYRKFARCIWVAKNTQWRDCNLYEANVDELYSAVILKNNFRPLLKK
jgi:hypothetical protein